MKATQYLATALILAAAASWGQNPPPGGPQGRPEAGDPPAMQMDRTGAPQRPGPGMGDPMMENFFPPELVMQHQGLLRLSNEQKTAIKDAIRKSVTEITDLQWQQSAETEVMAELLKQERVDEAKTLAQLDKLLDVEKQIKRLHLGVMIRVKNALTPDQQAKLRQLRQPAMPGRGQPQGQGGRPQGPGGSQERGGVGGPQEPHPAP